MVHIANRKAKITSLDENTEYFDLNEKVASLEGEKHFLLRTVEKLEASGNNLRVELEAKKREIGGLKQKLVELMIKHREWKREKDLLYMVKNELAKRTREEMLSTVSELENKLEIQEK
ncbi:hypothetical protein RND71_004695 [Anisodus tanguticus]|uniref:Uncharacterized protein n=1 Tax=Anisodus tanguticus TaxID=243964 RepID=A0AAE1VKU5_9SOLA|nr:hypothetical protein RND71_004695 [Anisodus tanguticus]